MKPLSLASMLLSLSMLASGPAFADIGTFASTTVGSPVFSPCDPADCSSQLDYGNYYTISALPTGWTDTTGGGTSTSANGADLAFVANGTTAGGAYAGDVGILLNEEPGQGMLFTPSQSFTIGQSYTVNYLYWGDNRPGEPYSFNVELNGITVQSVASADTIPTPDGTYESGSVTFTATKTSNTVGFIETTPGGSQASPIFGNVTVVPAPEPAGIVLLAIMLLGVGITFRRVLRRA